MAEGDRFERSFRPGGWRKAYRRARMEHAQTSEVVDLLFHALSKTLRSYGGVPGFDSICETLDRVELAMKVISISAEAADEFVRGLGEFDRIARDELGHRFTRIAAKSAKALLAERWGSTDHPASGTNRELLAERTCVEIIRNMFFSNARLQLVAEHKIASSGRATIWQQEIEAACVPGLKSMADRLAKDPLAVSLRSPKRQLRRTSTSKLVDEVLVSVAGSNE